ncbi:LPS:glycosyltransferase [Pseudomonas sp. GM50]|uniref:glycosyltransferase n=1 Tax=Pseudomonas sp. GM50 TaxID=1144332 RepID=UPI00027090A7|nr:glycosyltransferase [Pseudomonas sp. GM50]EJM65077.1 LPS:glycosyltransferase [Pseudomonas sp. GM50]
MAVPSGCSDDTVRIFVAATPAEWLPMRVLEYSIREHSTLPIELSTIYSHGREIPQPKALENRARTPFSFQRFLIPELCHFTGRAIYLDADMQVFKDIAELWDHPLEGNHLQTVSTANDGRRSQFSVMLLDCARLDWKVEDIVARLDDGSLDYQTLMFDMKVAREIGYGIPLKWNSLEAYMPDQTALLHYTDMNTQPWVSLHNTNGVLWISCLRRAIDSGFITRGEVMQEVEAGHVRPSLLAQLNADENSLRKLGISALWRDFAFHPPYYRLRGGWLRKLRSRTFHYLNLFRAMVCRS